jgi:hypothetical protein
MVDSFIPEFVKTRGEESRIPGGIYMEFFTFFEGSSGNYWVFVETFGQGIKKMVEGKKYKGRKELSGGHPENSPNKGL